MIKQSIILIIWFTFLLFVLYYVSASSIPYNPLTPSFSSKTKIMTFVPEGWGFFSRDPREPDLYLYELHGNKLIRNTHAPISSFANFFGLKRYPRAQSVELGMLLHNINDSLFKSCEINIEDRSEIDIESLNSVNDHLKLDRATIATVMNGSPYPTIKGIICIVQQEPIPWAWAWNRKTLKLPAKYLILNVKTS